MHPVTFLCLLAVGSSSADILPFLNKTLVSSPSHRSWPGTCDGSDSTHTQNCLDKYFAGWGFTLPKDTAPTFIDYMNVLSTLMKQYGDAGIDIYCDYESTLESCLGSLINTPCVSAENFAEMYFDLSTMDSIEYAINIPSGAYSCKNKALLKQYHSCYKDTDVNHHEEFVQCSITLEKELDGVVGSDRCIPWSHYSNCVTQIYVSNCGDGIKSFACNLEEIKLGIDVSACKKTMPDCDA